MTGRKEWAADDILSAADLESYLMDQVVTIWSNATARNSGILAPIEGQMCYLQDTSRYYSWDGSAWSEIIPPQTSITSGSYFWEIDNTGYVYLRNGATELFKIDPTGTVVTGSLDADKITSGTLAFARIPTGTSSSTVAVGDHNHDTRYYTQTVIDNAFASRDANISSLSSGVFNNDVWNRNVSGMTRYAAWLGNNGQILLGQTASSERFKTNITEDNQIDPVKVLELNVVLYNFIENVKAAENNPDVRVQLEIGMIAERLHEAGLWQFVGYERDENDQLILDKDGNVIPKSIHYELWALAVHVATQYVWAEHKKLASKVELLEARLAKLEK